MKRKDFEEAVYASSLNTNARFVALTYAQHQQYKDDGDQGNWPSQERVAQMTNMSPDTVSKFVNALIEDGWFVVIGMVGSGGGPKRVKVIRLEVGRGEHPALVAKRKGQSHATLTKAPIPYPLGDASPNGQEMHPLVVRGPSPNGQVLTTTLTTDNEQLLEQPLAPSASAPVAVRPGNVDNTHFLSRFSGLLVNGSVVPPSNPGSLEELPAGRPGESAAAAAESEYDRLISEREVVW